MAVDPDDPRLAYRPLTEVEVAPPGLLNHYKNCFWIVHPERGIVFWKTGSHHSPQCNSNRTITVRIQQTLYPWAEVTLVPSVFIPARVSDYA